MFGNSRTVVAYVNYFGSFLQVKEANMSCQCPCAGQFTETVVRQSFLEQMQTFSSIARYAAAFVCMGMESSVEEWRVVWRNGE